MVILDNPGQIYPDGNVVFFEMHGWAYIGQHQQLWRHKCSRSQDHFLTGPGLTRLAFLVIFDADGPAAVEHGPRDLGYGYQIQSRVIFNRLDEGVGGAAAFALDRGRLYVADALQTTTSEIRRERQAQPLHRTYEEIGRIHNVGRVGDLQGPIATMGLVLQTLIAFLPAEIGHEIVPAPACAARGFIPPLVVQPRTAGIGHDIDRATTADDIALRDDDGTPVQCFLRSGAIALDEGGIAENHLEGARRHPDQGALVVRPRLEQQDAGAVITHETVRGDAASTAGADDDKIVGHGHFFSQGSSCPAR